MTENIRLRARLQTAKEMLRAFPDQICIADIGTDHGRLACALLLEHSKWTCIATDISPASLKKAEEYAAQIGVEKRMQFRTGDGFQVLRPKEADVILCLGMGGELIRSFLESTENGEAFAEHFIFQPMKGIEELREYLYSHSYHIEKDLVVKEPGHMYQLLLVRPPDGKPENFPEGYYSVGYKAFSDRTPYFFEMLEKQRQGLLRCLETAKDSPGEEKITERLRITERLLKG